MTDRFCFVSAGAGRYCGFSRRLLPTSNPGSLNVKTVLPKSLKFKFYLDHRINEFKNCKRISAEREVRSTVFGNKF